MAENNGCESPKCRGRDHIRNSARKHLGNTILLSIFDHHLNPFAAMNRRLSVFISKIGGDAWRHCADGLLV